MTAYQRLRELATSGASYDEIEDRMAEEAEHRNEDARDRELEDQHADQTPTR